MPGFMIKDVGDGAPGVSIDTYYTYTWGIAQILGERAEEHPQLIYLKDMGLPTFSVGQERVKGSALNYKYASDITWDDVKISWYDVKGMLKIIKEWRSSVWTEEGGIQPATSYKRRSTLMTWLPDATAVNQWILHNSWPSTIRHGELTYTQSDVKIVDVILSYDWAEEIPS